MISFPRASRTVALALVASALVASVPAQDNAWIGGASYWDLASNWSLGLPGSGQRLFIGYDRYGFSGTTTYRSGTTSVASLFSRNGLFVSGGALNLTSTTESSTIDGALGVSGGTLGGSANLVVGGLTTLTGGVLGGSGKTSANGGVTISGGPVRIADTRTLQNMGAMTWSGGTVAVDAGATVDNAAGSTFLANAASTWTGGKLLNSGNLLHSAGTTTFSGVALGNAGTIESSGGVLRFLSPTGFSNLAGTIRASGNGQIFLQGGNYGMIGTGWTTSGNGRIAFSGATLTGSPAAPWTIPATVTAGSISLANSTLKSVDVKNSDRLGFGGSNTLDNVAGDRGFRFTGGGTQTIKNGFNPGGSVTLDFGSRLAFVGDRTVGYAIDVQENSTIPSSGILMEAGSTLTIAPTGSFGGTGGRIDAGGSAFAFRNEGTLSASAILTVDTGGGDFTNAGLIVGAGPAYDLDDPFNLLKVGEGSFLNEGTIRSTGSNVAIQGTGAATFHNAGVIEALGGGSVGIFQNYGGGGVAWSNAGVLRADGAGSRLYLGGTFSLPSLGNFSVTNGAHAVVYGGTLDNAGRTLTVNAPNAWMLSYGGRILGGKIVGSSNLGFDDYYRTQILENVDLDGGLNITNGGVRLVGSTHLNGTTTGSGRIEFTDDVTVDHDIVGSLGLSLTKPGGTITIATGSKYEGNLSITGINSGTAANVVNHGTLRGTASGYSYANLTNHGLLEQTADTLSLNSGSGFVNDGTVRVTGTGKLVLRGNGPVRNAGLMEATNGGVINLAPFSNSNVVTNTGTIRALGTGSAIQLGMYAPFTLESLGNIGAFDGAYLSVYANGKLDNTGRNLVLGSGPTGSLKVEAGGTIFGGQIVNSELLGLSSALNRQTLRDVYVDHGLNVAGGAIALEGSFRSGGTINASGAARIGFYSDKTIDYAVRFDGAPGEGGAIDFDGYGSGASVRIAPTGELSGRNLTISYGPGGRDFVNQGLIMAKGGGGKVELNGTFQNAGTMRATEGGTLRLDYYGQLTNVSGNTLTGGTYRADADSRIQVYGLDVRENAANVVLDGAGSRLEDMNGNDALRNLAVNSGKLSISGGRNLSLGQALQNSGTLSVASGSTLALAGRFVQTSTGVLSMGVDAGGMGLLSVTGDVALSGALDVALLGGYVPVVGSRYTFLTYTGSLSGSLTADPARYSILYGPGTLSLQVNAVPEPSVLVALATGGLALLRRRKR